MRKRFVLPLMLALMMLFLTACQNTPVDMQTDPDVTEVTEAPTAAPTEPASTEPASIEPASTEPAPAEPMSTEPACTEPAPTEPEETYGPCDIRTRTPEVGEIYYTEQVIEESKDEALALTQEILDNPGKVFVLGEGYENPLEVLLDVDLDGEPDRISLSIQGESKENYQYEEIDGIPYVGWELLTLNVNDSARESGSLGRKYSDELCRWNILAFSPDGTEIIFGTSKTIGFIPFRTVGLYTYDSENIAYIFPDSIDLLAETTKLGEDSIIAVRSTPPPIKAPVLFEWKRNSEGKYEPYYEDVYEFLEDYSFMLNISIKLYSQPDLESEVVGIIGPEKVTAKKSDFGLERYYKPSGLMWGSSQSWTYLETMDGLAGWVKMGSYIVNADGEVIDFLEGYLSEE